MKASAIHRQILKLAIPNILTNISVPMLSSVDTALMGRFSALHLGAVGLGSMIFNFVYWNFGFLRMGTVGLTAQAYGAGDNSRIVHTFLRALLLATALSLLILLLQTPLRELMVRLMQVNETLRPKVVNYFNIRIWAAPATMALYALTGFFFGMQNVWYPLWLTIFINVVNIGTSYGLVRYGGMEVDGVAWGTVTAQYAGLIAAMILFTFRYGHLLRHFRRKTLLQLEAVAAFFRINRDIFIRTLLLSTTFFLFYSLSARAGDIVLAANVVLLQFLNWMSFGVDGFAYAAEALVGKYKGARRTGLLHKTIRYVFYWGMGLALIYAGVYAWWGDSLLRLFTGQQDVQQAARQLLFWTVLLPVAGTPSYIWDGVYIGLTDSAGMRDTMLVAFMIFLATYYLSAGMGAHRLWLALAVFLLVRGAGQWWLYHRRTRA